MIEEKYCEDALMSKLFSVNAPLTKVTIENGVTPIFYTKSKNDPDWETCDAYYRPTIGAVVDWLSGLGYAMPISYTKKMYGVSVIYKDTHLCDEYWFGSRWRACEFGAMVALDYFKMNDLCGYLNTANGRVKEYVDKR